MNFHKYISLLVTVLALSFFSSCKKDLELTPEESAWLEAQDSVTVSVFPYYAPYQFKNKSGEVDGIFVDYLELIESKIGYTFIRKPYTEWPILLEDTKQGNLDIVLEIQATPERKEYLTFYDLFFESPQSLVTRKSDSSGNSLKDFYGKTITLPTDYAITKNIARDHPEINIKTEITDSVCLRKLNEGLYTAYIGPRAVVNHFKRVERLNKIKIITDLDYVYAPDIAVAKDKKILNQIFAKATASITQAEMAKIRDNWLFIQIKPFYKTPRFWINIAVGIALLLFLVLLTNRYLQYKVRKNTKDLTIAKQKAYESNKLRTQFIKNISHEIRTPINGILGNSYLLKNSNITPTDENLYVKQIQQSTKKLERTLSNIIEVSKLQTEAFIPNEQTVVQVQDIIEDTVAIYKYSAVKKGLEFKTIEEEIEINPIKINVDKFQRALELLLDNAVKFTETGGIVLSYGVTENNLHIRIKDSGIGINRTDEETIYTSFAQLQEAISTKHSGLGLGLTIARETILQLGGTISFLSEKGKGSVFIIKVPIKK